MNDYYDRKSLTLYVLRSKIVNWKQGHEDNEHSQRAIDFLIKKFSKQIFLDNMLRYNFLVKVLII